MQANQSDQCTHATHMHPGNACKKKSNPRPDPKGPSIMSFEDLYPQLHFNFCLNHCPPNPQVEVAEFVAHSGLKQPKRATHGSLWPGVVVLVLWNLNM